MNGKCRAGIILGLVGIALGLSFIHPISVKAQNRAVQPPPPVPAQVQVQVGIPAPGGPANDPKKGGFTDALSFPTDRKANRILEAAGDFIKEEAWGEAAKLLQSLLDTTEDIFVEIDRQGGKHWTSLKGEANRLLGTMPPQ